MYEASLWSDEQINVRGVISDEGSTSITEYGICYDDYSNLSIVSSNKIVLGKGTGSINYTFTIANLKMEGGAGQLNTVFSWKTLINTQIITGESTVFIK